MVAALRFTDNSADLTMHTFGTGQSISGEPVGQKLASLPDDTVAAIGLTGGDKLVDQAYQQLKDAGLTEALDSFGRDTGLTLPDDVEALVGTTTVVALGGTSDNPGFGAITHTSDVTRARAAAQKLLEKIDGSSSVSVQTAGDNTVFANSDEYASELGKSGGLGNNETFKAAMPDLSSAQFAIYADIQGAAKVGGEDHLSSSTAQLKAVGLTVSTQGDTGTLHLRVVV
jgi:hypothetical protein